LSFNNKLSYPIDIRILGVGKYLPKTAISTKKIDEMGGFKPGLSFKMNKVENRHFASEEETSTTMAFLALKEAMSISKTKASDIDTLISTSSVPEKLMPTNSCLIHQKLNGLNSSMNCFDINASCLGFLQGLLVGTSLISNGIAKVVGIVSSEIASIGLDWTDIKTCSLFGDGAASIIISSASQNNDNSKIINCLFKTYSEGADYCQIKAGGTLHYNTKPYLHKDDCYFKMQGPEVYDLSSKMLPLFMDELFLKTHLSMNDIDIIIPHQASHLGLHLLKKAVNVNAHKIVNILSRVGNQVSASLPNALYEAISTGRLKKGQTALLIGTGAGLTIGGIILRY
jgi:3-oxoacyl-[acyl-carrier-protein] synthase III